MFSPVPIPAFADNYFWCLDDREERVVVVDPGDSGPILRYLGEHQRKPGTILITHEHADHCGGLAELVRYYPDVRVLAQTGTQLAVPYQPVQHGACLNIGGLEIQVIATPGHTRLHLCYYLPEPEILFCGDTLFSAGCGRLFEGSAPDLLLSMQRLRALPETSMVCCAHEYTLTNLAFVRSIWPDNPFLHEFTQIMTKRLHEEQCTLPSTICYEKRINPFLNWDNPDLINRVQTRSGRKISQPEAVLYEIRQWRNTFRA